MTRADAVMILDRPTCTIPQAAQILGISRNAAYDAAHRGDIETIKIGRRLMAVTKPLSQRLRFEAASC